MAGPTEPAYKLTEPAIIHNETDIINYIEAMKNNGRSKATTTGRNRSLRQLSREANLRTPEEVKALIANKKWAPNTKHKTINNYNNFLQFLKIQWTPPNYKTQETLPFIPMETEIDQLIATLGITAAPFTQLLKETGMRSGEATLLKWTSLNTEQKTINIIPEKGSNPRILPISEKLIMMLKTMPHETENIFYQDLHVYRTAFCKQRKAATEKLKNPRIKQISFHTLRHWKGTMEYHNTKDIKHVQYILGHKSSKTTDLYINLEQATFLTNNNDEQWITKVSHNLEEEAHLIEANFTLVRSINETTAIYKKRK